MNPNRSARAEPAHVASAVVIDFEARRVERLQQRLDAAAPRAEAALARLEAGCGDWRELVTALVAAFNPS